MKLTTTDASKLRTITNKSFNTGNVINNAAPMAVYNEGDDCKLQLFSNRDQYHCDGPSVMDPQSSCPRLTKGGDTTNTLRVETTRNNYLELNYSLLGKPQLSFEIRILTSPTPLQTGIIHLDKQALSKRLQISSVIEHVIKYISDATLTVNDIGVDSLHLKNLVQIFASKLCGDFSQELFGIQNILRKKNTVFAANDGPSAIRFLFMTETVTLPINCLWWGGYLTAKNQLLLSSITKSKGALKKGKKKKKKKRNNKRTKRKIN